MRLIVWGCGERCRYFIDHGYLKVSDIVGFVDSNPSLKEFYGKKTYCPEQMLELKNSYDIILVTTKEKYMCEQIMLLMKQYPFAMRKLVFIYNYFPIICQQEIHKQCDAVLQEVSEGLYQIAKEHKQSMEQYQVVYRCITDQIDKSFLLDKSTFAVEKYQLDYMRYRTFELLAKEIEENAVVGQVAELGVFKGDFAKLINSVFPNRKLYLYDTFESFNSEEYMSEVEEIKEFENFREELKSVFKYTSVEKVLGIMPYSENCIVRKGYFPESVEENDKEERFAFVSLDVDLEQSTYAGLCFFIPRLSEGGYLFIHDYNNGMWGGVKSAVNRYEHENGCRLKKVPICDQCGTLVITK